MAKPIRLGIIGTGRFGRLHMDVCKSLSDCSIDAVSDVNPKVLKSASLKYGIKTTYQNAMDLIRSSKIDAVDIVTDEFSHGRFVIEALKHGKHVFVEKPLATDYDDAKKIEALSKKTGLVVMVGNISRFSQPYITLKRRVDSGEIGKLGIIRAKRDFSRSWFKFFGKRIHTVYESGIHDIDLILWLARGKCVRVNAVERRLSGCKYPEIFTAILTFDDGLIATLTSAWLVSDSGPKNLVETLDLGGTIDADLEILGTKGIARFRLLDSGLTISTDKAVQNPEMTLWATGHEGVGGAIHSELVHFIKQVVEGRESPIAPLSDSVYAITIAEAIVLSAKSGKTIRLKGGRF